MRHWRYYAWRILCKLDFHQMRVQGHTDQECDKCRLEVFRTGMKFCDGKKPECKYEYYYICVTGDCEEMSWDNATNKEIKINMDKLVPLELD